MVEYCSSLMVDRGKDDTIQAVHLLKTATTSESLASPRKNIEMHIAQQEAFDAHIN